MSDELSRCLTALYVQVPESVAQDVGRIVMGEIERLRGEVERLTSLRQQCDSPEPVIGCDCIRCQKHVAWRAERAEAESVALAARLEEAEALVRRLHDIWDGTLHGDDFWQARAKVLKDAAAFLASSGQKEG